MGWAAIKPLGEGAQGSVSLARSTPSAADDKITVALNLPPLIAVKSAPFSESEPLQYEREMLRALRDCPEIITCFGADASYDDGVIRYNIFLEYAAGGSLIDRVKSGKPLGEEEMKGYTKSILRGLKHIHSKGMVHCDIKPGNILLVVDDHRGCYVSKIGDFGLALQQEIDGHEALRGTLPYLAPESILYGEYGCGVDIWAVGCTVAEMLVRKRLRKFNADFKPTWEEVEHMAKQGVDIPHGICEDARDFLIKCLTSDPAKRWSADKLLKDHPFISEKIRCTKVSSDPNYLSLDVGDEEASEPMMPMIPLERNLEDISDEEELNRLIMPMKLFKRDREDAYLEDISDEEELNKLIMPMKLFKRDREDASDDDAYPAFCKKPKLDPQVCKPAARGV